MTLIQGKGYSAYIPSLGNIFTAMFNRDNVSHDNCPLPKVFFMTLTQVHIIKVTVDTYPKSVSGQELISVMLDLDNILHNYCPLPKGTLTV